MSVPHNKKQFRSKTDADEDEHDVFEASRYFSVYNETSNTIRTHSQHKVFTRDHEYHHTKQQRYHSWNWKPSRRSLDVPMPMRDAILSQQPQRDQSYVVDQKHKEKKVYKQPRSPGGRLASFLNSLFSQSSSSKKKKSKSTTITAQSMKDQHEEDHSPGGRRKRRSSISHFRSSHSDTKSLYSSSSSGFRTPPPYNLHTPTKSYKDYNNKQIASSSSSSSSAMKPSDSKRVVNNDLAWLDEKLKLIDELSMEKPKIDGKYGLEKEKALIRLMENEDDGNESDSSSDLFELQIYDLDIYSRTGLPVYETTHIDSLKSSGAMPIST